MYTYLWPRDALFQLARARRCWNYYAMGLAPTNVWEGMHKSKLVKSWGLKKPEDWECAFWRTADDERSAYFSERIADIREAERAELPFFIVAAKDLTVSDGCHEIDLTNSLRSFAWKTNTIGGTSFWEWFLMKFGDGLLLSNVELSIVTSDTFTETVLDPSRVMVL